MEIKFKVLKRLTGANKYGDSWPGEGTTLSADTKDDPWDIRLMRELTEYFMEIQPGGKRFDDEWEYAGRVAIPKDGEHFARVASKGYNLAVWVNGDYGNYENILRERKTGPTKQETIKVLEDSIEKLQECKDELEKGNDSI